MIRQVSLCFSVTSLVLNGNFGLPANDVKRSWSNTCWMSLNVRSSTLLEDWGTMPKSMVFFIYSPLAADMNVEICLSRVKLESRMTWKPFGPPEETEEQLGNPKKGQSHAKHQEACRRTVRVCGWSMAEGFRFQRWDPWSKGTSSVSCHVRRRGDECCVFLLSSRSRKVPKGRNMFRCLPLAEYALKTQRDLCFLHVKQKITVTVYKVGPNFSASHSIRKVHFGFLRCLKASMCELCQEDRCTSPRSWKCA